MWYLLRLLAKAAPNDLSNLFSFFFCVCVCVVGGGWWGLNFIRTTQQTQRPKPWMIWISCCPWDRRPLFPPPQRDRKLNWSSNTSWKHSVCCARSCMLFCFLFFYCVLTPVLAPLQAQVRRSFDGGCQRWSPTQQLEVMGVSVSARVCDASLIPLKEFLIELVETDGMHSLRHDGLTHVKSSFQPSQSSCLQHFFHSAPTGQHKGWRIN